MLDRYAHCTFCGARFTPGQPWPRRCAACAEISYLNPKPVAVAVQPVGGGLLVVRRGFAPARGWLALPGGFIEVDETWQQALVRELEEETGLVSEARTVRLYDTLSASDGTLLVFGVLPPVDTRPDFTPTEEIPAIDVLTEPEPLAFPLHTAVATRYLTGN